MVESVDRWPLAIVIFRRTRGYAHVPVTAFWRDRRWAASSWGDDARAPWPCAADVRADLALGNSVAAIGWRQVRTGGLTPGGEAAPGACTPPSTIYSGRRSRGPPVR